MSFDGFLFSLKNAVSNIFRNYVLTIASVIVLGVCLLSLGSTMLVVQDVDAIVDSVGSENRVVIFLNEDISQTGINDVRAQLEQIKNITNIVYESPEQSLENYTSQLGSQTVTGLDAAVFRPSFIFDIIDLNKYEQTVYAIEQIDGLGVFESGESAGQPAIRTTKTLINRIVYIKQLLSFFSVVVIIVFFFLSMFIIMNSVKMSVFARRTEINIMKYVGATNGFIRLPFIVEGMSLGVISGAISYGLIYFGYDYFTKWVLSQKSEWFSMLVSGMVPFTAISHQLLIGFLGGGALIGIFGCVAFIGKHLKV